MIPDMQRVESVFLKAVQEPTPTSQAAVLDDECGSDDELRRWVMEMLRKHDRAETLAVDTPVFDSVTRPPVTNHKTPSSAIQLPCGTVITGRYRLLECLGQGGMGTVYRAQQIYPVQRIFAVKVIKPGLDSQSLLTRFESEWQALAKMDHPNIAKIHDSGTVGREPWGGEEKEGSGQRSMERSEEKRAGAFLPSSHNPMSTDRPTANGPRPTFQCPFFVMEFVDGIPITQFCKQERLTLRQRIDLFIPVCLAIEHAHQKGVIHRDLKPANILVTKKDKPVPVVIDFGIAKCIDGPIDKVTHHTGWGLFLGTLDYMAPEQAVGNSKAVDTRTDVYSLGAVFYELLTGLVPLDRSMAGESVFDLVTLLVEQEPMPPSVRVGRRNQTREQRGQRAELRGELDWIVMKCLEKDRERRYPSARALADDLSRYLSNEPVSAGPPTAGYRLRKLIQRHVGGVIAVCCVLLALVGAIAGTTWGMIQARQAEAIAFKAVEDKEKARAAEAQERIRADAKSAQAEFISNFIQFDVIRQANPRWQSQLGFTPDANLTVREALDRAAATIEKRFGDKPLVVAALFDTIGTSYDGLGEYNNAIKHFARSLEIYEHQWGPKDDRTIGARQLLARSYYRAKKANDAVPLFESNLHLIRATHRQENERVLNAETDLANAYRDLGRLDDAERLLSHVYEIVQASAPNSEGAIHTLMNLAGIDEKRGRSDEAIKKIESIQAQLTRNQDSDPMAKFVADMGLGRFYCARGKDEGFRLLESARKIAESVLGCEHSEHLNAIAILSEAYLTAGRPKDAVQLLDRTHKSLQSKLKMYDARIYQVALLLADMAIETNELDRAEKLARETDAAALGSKNRVSHIRGQALSIHGRCLYLTNHTEEAEPKVREALAILSVQQPDEAQTHATRVLLGQILVTQGRYAEAEPELTAGYQELKKQGRKPSFAIRRRLPEVLEALIQCAESLNHSEDVAKWRAEQKRLN